ncbi:MAG: hypothetical protein COW84_10460 [Gammaproteobacteria bacterium CG22_combo_CG10-13_8_21_14_all_40_8]|nr:MAG: hypothetical protein COW84_10460 [Gammaproteobacteria bacterium CG22_combo_CG10-13_8_21_14_all_40_8]
MTLKTIRNLWFTLFCLLIGSSQLVAEEFARVKVMDAFIEMHTGPGRGFPIFFVAEQGEEIEILKSKTSWYKVRLKSHKMGWVPREQLAKTLQLDGQKIVIKDADFNEYLNKKWEFGALTGEFEGASLISIYAGYHFTENLSTEVTISQALGNFSEIRMATTNIVNEPFPDLKPFSWLPYVDKFTLSPFFGIGTGVIQTLPRATLVNAQDRNDNLLFVTTGAKFYLTRRFLLRMEYRHFVVLTDRNQNEDADEWKLGFSIFF